MQSTQTSTPFQLFREGRRAFLTGGSRGLGKAFREELERHGVEVICPARNELDLSNVESVQAFLARSKSLSFDILINNAGINFPAPVDDLSLDNWQATVQVNLNAPFLLSQHFSKAMRERGWGRILNVSSVFSLVTRDARAVYSASKSALNGFTRTCAVEWGKQGVLVNAICPGFVNTDLTRQNNSEADLERIRGMIPMGRLAEPGEIAKAAVYLCSDMNTYMTGQCVVVDGGFTLR